MSERDEQIQFFSELERLAGMHPEMEEDFSWIYASMNGAWMRSKKQAVIALREGLKPGIWDIHWPYKTDKYPGLWIEMKYGKNTLTENQIKFQGWILRQGYRTEVCYTWIEAIQVICDYAGIRAPGYEVQ